MGTYGAPIYLTPDITAFHAYGGGYHLLNKDDIYCGRVTVPELAAIPEVAALVEAGRAADLMLTSISQEHNVEAYPLQVKYLSKAAEKVREALAPFEKGK